MFIAFDEESNGKNFMANTMIKGHILVDCEEEFAAESLTLTLKGFERAQFEQGQGDAVRVVKKSEQIVNLSYTLQTWGASAPPVKGFLKQPFELHLPSWLPGACMLQDGRNNCSCSYYLVAQLEPRDDALLADV